ncbi:FimV/HubP family polar landmark protein [Nitrincola nitratireducens]|uniref:Tfp pilus assembly protein FimV n=1 Tax=Nitrincola nitratireducens TaxID=1229521 RepID=W9VH23_9GAMM|nr:FimV/HubP family polar landmark protein [Nitrincola nitratireducens]EXJ09945.1 Tfp pilus assembly protein FimV [Nitrincola nitratireducens]
MLRKLALSLAVAGVLGMPNAHALGLGEINIKSALNEPLNAEIRLMQLNDLSPLQIQPKMANADDFSLAGLNRSGIINNIRFQVYASPDGTGVIRLTSNDPVREPFLNFLLEVNWPSGRLVREYTVLLDPPAFDPAPVARSVQPAASTSPSVAVTPAQPARPAQPLPSPVADTPASAPSPAPTTRAADPSQIQVQRGDTLWVLANRFKPDASISTDQMMLAIQRKNPQAFPSGNINMMSAGTVLSIPTAAEVGTLTSREASLEVARQNDLWRLRGRTTTPVESVSQVAATAEPTDAPTTPVEATERVESEVAQAQSVVPTAEAELRIVTPDLDQRITSDQPAVAGDQERTVAQAPDTTAQSVDGLLQRSGEIEQQLMFTLETIDKLERENIDLNEQLESVQDQLALMQRMLELKDQDLAALQALVEQNVSSEGREESAKLFMLYGIGGISIAALLASIAALLVGRRRKNAAAKSSKYNVAVKDDTSDSDTIPKVATAAAATALAGAAVAQAQEEQQDAPVAAAEEATEFVSEELDTSGEENDFADLDLDMDLDLDLNLDDDPVDDVKVIDEEFDLSAVVEPEIENTSEVDDVSETDFDALAAESFDELEFNDDESEEIQASDESLEEMDLDDLMDITDAPDALDTYESSSDASLDDDIDLEFSIDDIAQRDPLDERVSDADPEVDDEDLLDFSDLALSDAAETEEDQDQDQEVSAANDMDELEFSLSEADFDAAEDETLDDDLEALSNDLAFELDDAETVDDAEAPKTSPGKKTEEELTANIAHDLEMGLDDELDDILASTDDDIALDESDSYEEAIDLLDNLNLLDGADENETKLDLARAYIEMDDAEGAREILGEIAREGNEAQRSEAEKLLNSLS